MSKVAKPPTQQRMEASPLFWYEAAKVDATAELADAMKAAGVDARELSNRTGITPKRIHRILGGEVGLRALARVALALGYRIEIKLVRISCDSTGGRA